MIIRNQFGVHTMVFKLCQMGLQSLRLDCEVFKQSELILEYLGDDLKVDRFPALLNRDNKLQYFLVTFLVDALKLLFGVLLAMILEKEDGAKLTFPQQNVPLEFLNFLMYF